MLQIPVWKRIAILAVCLAGLLFTFPNLFYERVETRNDAIVEIEKNGSTPEREAEVAGWPSPMFPIPSREAAVLPKQVLLWALTGFR